MRTEVERLRDIVEAIERIEKYAAQGRNAFDEDELIQTWIVHHIELIGQACRALPEEFQARYAGVPWSDIIGIWEGERAWRRSCIATLRKWLKKLFRQGIHAITRFQASGVGLAGHFTFGDTRQMSGCT